MNSDKAREAGYEDEKEALNQPGDGAAVPVGESGNMMDSSKVNFINGQAQDARVEISEPGEKGEFVGLTKEELMKYANDPYWIRVRWIFLILFWVAWFAMLAAAIIIIIVAPRCPHRPNLAWWQKDVIYQVYPRSFKDSNGDGIGDLQGIKESLDYIKNDIGANAVWLNSIYQSPNQDFGYDVSDYKAINPEYGTMEEFDQLRSAMHARGMKLIMDFVPNHSSDKHAWFEASKADKNNDYSDYYVWADGSSTQPPNNWVSVFGGPAWTYDNTRGQWYLHQFLKDQPDLNLRNPQVQAELEEIMKFWLDKGVDGFRIDAVTHLFESNKTSFDGLNEDKSPNATTDDTDDYDYYDHKYTAFQPETYDLITRWRELTDKVYVDTEQQRFLFVETYGTPEQVMPFYEYNEKKGADMPFNMNLLNLKKDCGGKCVRNLVNNWMSNMPKDRWANWVLGNHDNSRISTRLGENSVNAANMLAMLLPGTACTYYGEELGMVDGDIEWADVKDPRGVKAGESGFKEVTRDPERTPMQWNTDKYAGFTTGDNPWLPINEDYKERNVKVQLATGSGQSTVELYHSFSKLRKEPSFQWGHYAEALTDDSLFSFVRKADGFDQYLVAINFGPHTTVLDFHSSRPELIPATGTVAATTANFNSNDFAVGNVVSLDNIVLKVNQGVVLKWAHDAFEE